MPSLTTEEFRALRTSLKDALSMEDCALEAGDVVSLKPADGYVLPADGRSFEARYRTGGIAEHDGDVSEMESAIAKLRGKIANVEVSGRNCRVEVVGSTVTNIKKGESEDGDGEFSVSAIFVLQCRLSE